MAHVAPQGPCCDLRLDQVADQLERGGGSRSGPERRAGGEPLGRGRPSGGPVPWRLAQLVRSRLGGGHPPPVPELEAAAPGERADQDHALAAPTDGDRPPPRVDDPSASVTAVCAVYPGLFVDTVRNVHNENPGDPVGGSTAISLTASSISALSPTLYGIAHRYSDSVISGFTGSHSARRFGGHLCATTL